MRERYVVGTTGFVTIFNYTIISLFFFSLSSPAVFSFQLSFCSLSRTANDTFSIYELQLFSALNSIHMRSVCTQFFLYSVHWNEIDGFLFNFTLLTTRRTRRTVTGRRSFDRTDWIHINISATRYGAQELSWSSFYYVRASQVNRPQVQPAQKFKWNEMMPWVKNIKCVLMRLSIAKSGARRNWIRGTQTRKHGRAE